jgi:Na+(H+)/acetate symporter ActP
VWIYSTTLVQQRVDPSFRGSVFAAELALYTVAYSASSMGAGAAFQQHLLSTRGVATVLTAAAGVLLVIPALLAPLNRHGWFRFSQVTGIATLTTVTEWWNAGRG